MERRFAIVFSNDMQHPLYISVKTRTEFIFKLQDIIEKYGDFELIYRVY